MMEILRAAFADFHPQFMAAVVEIIWINVLLSGDNALVIALACRALPRRQRLVGMPSARRPRSFCASPSQASSRS
jgi:predicted tellurium resistance membrane protein TerC